MAPPANPSPSKRSAKNAAKTVAEEPTTAHDWRNEKTTKMKDAGISPVEVEFFDDGTITFFWCVAGPLVVSALKPCSFTGGVTLC